MSVRERVWQSGGKEHRAWVAAYTDASGARRIKTFTTKRAAKDYEAKVRGDLGRGVHVPESQSITVADAADKWLAKCEADGLERSTVTQYRQHRDLHIVPFIGTEKLTSVTPPFALAFLERLSKEGRSSAMVRAVRVSLSGILSDALGRGDVAFNAVRDLGRAANKARSRAAKRHDEPVKVGVDLPTREELKALLDAASGKAKVFIMTAAFTGMRASELRGLRWADIDLEGRIVSINQRADAWQEIGSPKSVKGRRRIPLPSFVTDALKTWKIDCPASKLDLVFPTGAGNLEYHANMASRWFGIPQRDAKILNSEGEAKYSGLHCLRHFYASWCINPKSAGGLELPAKVVQERLGHSSITVTLDTYGHLFPSSDTGSEMEAAGDFFIGKRDTNAT